MTNSADPDQLASLDLHCLQRQGISGFSRTRVKSIYLQYSGRYASANSVESSLGTFWIAKGAKFLHADNEVKVEKHEVLKFDCDFGVVLLIALNADKQRFVFKWYHTLPVRQLRSKG